MISPIMDEMGAIIGGGTSLGRLVVTNCSFSFTICRALKMSVPQSNSTHTMDTPFAVDDRTRRTPVAPLTDVSMGMVTRRSTSSGAIPCASVITVTVGAVKSGKTSTGILSTTYAPAKNNTIEVTTTTRR